MIKNNIPNAVTSLNCLCGTQAIIAAFHGVNDTLWGMIGYQMAALLIGLAAVADFLDGLTARLLHAVSGIGKELDSLSDLVSFGLAPAMMIFNVMRAAQPQSALCYAAVLLPVFGALRLARFNVDTRQTTSFIGLPIPANAIFWIGMTHFYATHHDMSQWIVVAAIVALSWLMVCPLPMFSLKAHSLGLRDNWPQYALIVGALALIGLLGLTGLAATIALYAILSIVNNTRHNTQDNS